MLVRVDGFTLLTDPHFSTHAGPGGRIGTPRVRPPGIEPRDLPAVHAVFISHNHYDHLDIASLRWLTAQRAPTFVVPLGLKQPLERKGIGPVTELDWWQSTDVIGATITATPAMHWSNRTMLDRRRTLWAGCLLKVPYAPSIYFAGDTRLRAVLLDHPRTPRHARRRAAADRRLRAALVHAAVPHERRRKRCRRTRRSARKDSIATHHSYFRLADDGFESAGAAPRRRARRSWRSRPTTSGFWTSASQSCSDGPATVGRCGSRALRPRSRG